MNDADSCFAVDQHGNGPTWSILFNDVANRLSEVQGRSKIIEP